MKYQASSSDQSESADLIISDFAKTTFQKVALNALVIAALSILVNVCLRVDFTLLHHGLGETSATELAQLMMLAVTSLSFFHLVRTKSSVTYAAALVSGFFMVMFIREMDVWFDMIAHGAWVVPALTITFAACYFAFSGGKKTIDQMALLLNTRYMPVLITSAVLLLVFTRLYGMGSFWHSVMGDHYIRDVKNLSEEATELMAYSIIAFAAVKTCLLVKRSDALDQGSDLTKLSSH
ncbi:hypothetical protein [Vibrio sp. TBV020]|uniref:hypothetical protein n=1 Tax=Vibrio sp. TBV020 TaxID=3137398 RepID=UPI0038CD4105